MEHEKWWASEEEIAHCDLCNSVAVAWKCWKKGSSLTRKIIEMEMQNESEPDFFLCDKCYEDAVNEPHEDWELFSFEFAQPVA